MIINKISKVKTLFKIINFDQCPEHRVSEHFIFASSALRRRVFSPCFPLLLIIFKLIKVIQQSYKQNNEMKEEDPPYPKQNNKTNNNATNSVRFQIRDDPFIVPIKFKRELQINKNIFELAEPQPKNYQQQEEKVETEMTMLDPLQMSIATTKFLLLEKIISYASIFSIALSIYSTHYVDDEGILSSLNILHSAITFLLIVCTIFSTYFHLQNNRSRRTSHNFIILRTVVKCVVVLAAPNFWWDGKELLLHLALLGRIYFPLVYYIRSTLYYSPRAARIIYLYGIKPEVTFQFAWKVILNSMGIFQVLIIYITVVMFYSHCLFLAAEGIPFIDCFQIVIVTLPTVGFGDYRVTGGFPRAIILLVLLSGVGLNAFVTLTLLKKFEMSTNENNSYQLMEKLNMIERIQELSSQFIIRKFRKGQQGEISHLAEREKDEKFKQQYKDCKTRYREINSQDSAYQFNFFKDSLLNLKIKIHQVNNMLNVLIARLTAHRQQHKSYFKHLPKT